MEIAICTKRAFYAKKEVIQSIKKSNVKLHPYLCRYCNKWHATRQRQTINELSAQKDINKNKEMLIHMIQNENENAHFLSRLSKKKTAWEVILGNKKYNIIYNKRQKTIEPIWRS